MTTRGKVLVGLGALALGALVVAAMSNDVQAQAFALALPSYGRPFAGAILAAAKKHGLNPFKLAGLIDRESKFGLYLEPRGPGGTGDYGHGHGLTQIDDRTWGVWLHTNDWTNPAVNIDKGAEILAAELARFGGDYAKALAAYNAGSDAVKHAIARGAHVDTVTTGKDYSTDVLARADRFERLAKA